MDGSTGPGGGSLPHSGLSRRTAESAELSAPADLSTQRRPTVARLLVRGMDAMMRVMIRLLGESATASRANITTAELRDLVANSEALDRDERRLIDEVIVAGERHVRELMVPRTDVVFLEAAASLVEAVSTVRASRHSRFPVVDGSHDDVVGFVHLRDLLIRPEVEIARTVGEISRPLRQLPASKRALSALSEMRREGDHLALVVDEYGGTAGIVTLEDLIEELVGEIHDEYDVAPEVEASEGVAPAEVDGRLNLNDFAERAGFPLPTGPYDTVGGFLMAALGRLPTIGDEVVVGAAEQRWLLRVAAMEGRRVARVGLRPSVPTVVAPRTEVTAVVSAGQPS